MVGPTDTRPGCAAKAFARQTKAVTTSLVTRVVDQVSDGDPPMLKQARQLVDAIFGDGGSGSGSGIGGPGGSVLGHGGSSGGAIGAGGGGDGCALEGPPPPNLPLAIPASVSEAFGYKGTLFLSKQTGGDTSAASTSTAPSPTAAAPAAGGVGTKRKTRWDSIGTRSAGSGGGATRTPRGDTSAPGS